MSIDSKYITNIANIATTRAVALIKENNLNDVANIATARTNINVYSKTEVYNKTEVDTKISVSQPDLTNYYNKTEVDTVNNGNTKKANNLSDVASVASARTNLDVYSKAESFGIANLLNEISTTQQKQTALTNLFSQVDSSFIASLLNIASGGAAGFYTGDYKFSAQNANHDHWLLCNGSAVSRSTYSTLFTLIGTSFGGGDGSTTFNLPDFRGRVAGGIGQGTNLTNRTIGQSVGEEAHILTIDEMPRHDHGIKELISAQSLLRYDPGLNFGTNSTYMQGGDQPHNNMQPTLFAGNWFIYY